MDRLESFTQTYTQAPWRKQLQIIGLFSLFLVFIALIAGIYLSVSARTATMGREIQRMQEQIDTLDQEIEDLNSDLAFILSAGEMEKRAQDLGFEPIQTDQVLYIVVPDYAGRQPAVLAPYSSRSVVSAPVVPAQYTESLFDWLKRQLDEQIVPPSSVVTEAQP